MKPVETGWKRAALLACVVIAGGATGAAGAADPPATKALELSALTGPQGADLYIQVPPGAAAFEHVHVQIRAPEGSDERANRIINLKDVAAPDGVATIDLGEVGRGAAVSVDVHVREEKPPRTAIHRGATIVKLRPDLAVTAVHAPPQTLFVLVVDGIINIFRASFCPYVVDVSIKKISINRVALYLVEKLIGFIYCQGIFKNI